MTSERDKPSADTPTGGRCPICGKPAIVASRPFCSKRCANIDLGRWMSGSYVIAGGLADADEDGDDAAALETGKSLPHGSGREHDKDR